MEQESTHDLDIAIVGMAGRFPGAADLDIFWQNLVHGVESVRFFSDEELLGAGVAPELLADPAYVKAGAVLDNIEWFDASFFGYSPREAAIIDPQQRLFLECAWEALERAGYDTETFSGRIGIYAGTSTNTYVLFNLAAGPALFCVHPAGGSVLCYAELAKALGPEQPLYGIQSPSFSGAPEHATIEESAAAYVAAIRAVQPHGPYLLGGLSYGGNVAFEMARQLQSQGKAVPLLALFDSHPPMAYHHTAPDDARFLAAFPLVFGMYVGIDAHLDVDHLRRLSPDRQIDEVIALLRQSESLAAQLDSIDVHQLFQIWKAHHHALRSYDPPRRAVSQPITLFRAIESQPPEILKLLNIHLPPGVEVEGWGRLTTSDVTIYDAPGSHYTMLNEPHIRTLASRLNACLETIQSSDVYTAWR